MADDDPFNMQPVVSSQIAAVGFNPDTRQIKIEFSKNGAQYLYESCTQAEFDALVNAPSVGQQFGASIKGVKPFSRIL